MSIESVTPSNYLILCHSLLLLPSLFPNIRVFSDESALRLRWPKDWSFSFTSPSNEHPGLISFSMDWLDLLADQGSLKSLLQHHSSKASILCCSAFFIVQLQSTRRVLIWEKLDEKILSGVIFDLRLERGMNTKTQVKRVPCRKMLWNQMHMVRNGREGEKEGTKGRLVRVEPSGREGACSEVGSGRQPLPFSSRGIWILF